MVDLFDRFSSPFSAGVSSEPESPAPVPVPEPEPEPVAEPTVSEPSVAEVKKPAAKKHKSASKPKAVASSPLSKAAVERVLSFESRLGDASGEAKQIAASLLGVKRSDDVVSMIVALNDVESVEAAKRIVSEASDLAGMDDLKFAVSVAAKSHAERKALWDMASKVADSVPDGKFPQADVAREVTMLRAVLSGGVADRLSAVLDLLA